MDATLKWINKGVKQVRRGMSYSEKDFKIHTEDIKNIVQEKENMITALRDKINLKKNSEAARLVREIRNPKSSLISE